MVVDKTVLLQNLRCTAKDIQGMLDVDETMKTLREMDLGDVAAYVKALNDSAIVLEEGVKYHLPEESKSTVIPGVPYYSQVGNTYRNNCGQACVRMMFGMHRLRHHMEDPLHLSVDKLKQLLTVERRNGTSFTSDLVNAANWLDLQYAAGTTPFKLVSTNGADIRLTPERIRSEIDAGRPCIQLINYEHLSGGWDPNFKSGHYVLVVGYKDDGYCVHDPYWPEAQGAYHWVNGAEFDKAIVQGGKWFSVPYQGCIWETG